MVANLKNHGAAAYRMNNGAGGASGNGLRLGEFTSRIEVCAVPVSETGLSIGE
jgi:hypothetical protein